MKNLLVGLPATDAEVAAVTADPSALGSLVRQWMALPQYNPLMLQFFSDAFQQSELRLDLLSPQFDTEPPFASNEPQFIENVQQSFARTALELIAEGQPFTSTMNTTRFMMTPALMGAYALLDVLPTDDQGNTVDLFAQNTPVTLTLQSGTTVPIEDAIDPANASYMMFTDSTLASAYDPNCPVGTVTYPPAATARELQNFLFDLTPHDFVYDIPGGMPGYICNPPAIPESAAYLQPSDFTDWRMVTIRTPQPGEATTRFYDLPSVQVRRGSCPERAAGRLLFDPLLPRAVGRRSEQPRPGDAEPDDDRRARAADRPDEYDDAEQPRRGGPAARAARYDLLRLPHDARSDAAVLPSGLHAQLQQPAGPR